MSDTLVHTTIETAKLLRLDDKHDAASSQVEAVHHLVKKHGLRPLAGIKPYVFSAEELERFAHDQTERFSGGNGEPD